MLHCVSFINTSSFKSTNLLLYLVVGHTQPNIDELGLAFRDMHINIADLEEYVKYVDSGPAYDVPKFPVARESHLNFLKPGSGEVVTRPVHVNEHLPPMFKISEGISIFFYVFIYGLFFKPATCCRVFSF